jgi:hypothetical protein
MALNAHVFGKHGHVCGICGRWFALERGYVCHYQIHHPEGRKEGDRFLSIEEHKQLAKQMVKDKKMRWAPRWLKGIPKMTKKVKVRERKKSKGNTEQTTQPTSTGRETTRSKQKKERPERKRDKNGKLVSKKKLAAKKERMQRFQILKKDRIKRQRAAEGGASADTTTNPKKRKKPSATKSSEKASTPQPVKQKFSKPPSAKKPKYDPFRLE